MNLLNSTNKDPLKTPIQYVKGVGPYLAQLLSKKGIKTVTDLFYYFPHRYVDYRNLSTIRQLNPGKEKCIQAEVVGLGSRYLGRTRKKICEMVVSDGTGVALVVWFHFKEKYLKQKFPSGKKLFIAGECQMFGSHKQFVHPEIEELEEEQERLASIVPVYPLTEGLHQKTIRKIIRNALLEYLDYLKECPLSVRECGEIKISLKQALQNIHNPPEDIEVGDLDNNRTPWHQRVIYDELFFLQLGLTLKKRGYKKEKAYPLKTAKDMIRRAEQSLPFCLTRAQKRSLEEILIDLKKEQPMNRLLQGDVGSGKTLVAFLSALLAIENGCQSALMVPTEILAMQHFSHLYPLATALGFKMALLTGSTSKGLKKEILDGLKTGEIHMVIGTHALIQEEVQFFKLAFIIIDEQHRFGVLQRAALKEKGVCQQLPHILVMTATPIPRTLSMVVYGDLDVSIIDEMPPGRLPVQTKVLYGLQRQKAYELIRKELKKGRQAYFIYPLIEESDKLELKDAISMEKELKADFPEYSIGLLHGRMPPDEKEFIMREFKNGALSILVSTTVIEVGVDVPNSTVMVIEHAERFGLSQLHQLRGRVGRGGGEAYCLLLPGYAQSEETRHRLKIMEETTDGFKIAEEDLKIRGPGDFLGTRQSGLPELRLVHLVRDQHLLKAAQKRAQEIVDSDPSLQLDKHQQIKAILKQRWEGKMALAEVS